MEHTDDTEKAKGNRCEFSDSNPFRVLCVLRVQSSLHPLWTGRTVASFEARCLNEAQWQQIGGASSPMRKTIGDAGSLLLRQTDVSVAVVRKPDRPWLRAVGDAIELSIQYKLQSATA